MKTQTILVTIQPEHKAFVQRAAKSAGVTVSQLARKALVSIAADLLGEAAPAVAAITPGARNPFADKAQAAGLTPKGYMRMVACKAEGIEFKPRKGESVKAEEPKS